jgi:hypothetical protein
MIRSLIQSQSLRRKIILVFLACFSIAAMIVTRKGTAATPANGTLSQGTSVLSYTSGPFTVSNPTEQRHCSTLR